MIIGSGILMLSVILGVPICNLQNSAWSALPALAAMNDGSSSCSAETRCSSERRFGKTPALTEVDGAIGRREEKARQGNRDGTHRDVRGARRA